MVAAAQLDHRHRNGVEHQAHDQQHGQPGRHDAAGREQSGQGQQRQVVAAGVEVAAYRGHLAAAACQGAVQQVGQEDRRGDRNQCGCRIGARSVTPQQGERRYRAQAQERQCVGQRQAGDPAVRWRIYRLELLVPPEQQSTDERVKQHRSDRERVPACRHRGQRPVEDDLQRREPEQYRQELLRQAALMCRPGIEQRAQIPVQRSQRGGNHQREGHQHHAFYQFGRERMLLRQGEQREQADHAGILQHGLDLAGQLGAVVQPEPHRCRPDDQVHGRLAGQKQGEQPCRREVGAGKRPEYAQEQEEIGERIDPSAELVAGRRLGAGGSCAGGQVLGAPGRGAVEVVGEGGRQHQGECRQRRRRRGPSGAARLAGEHEERTGAHRQAGQRERIRRQAQQPGAGGRSGWRSLTSGHGRGLGRPLHPGASIAGFGSVRPPRGTSSRRARQAQKKLPRAVDRSDPGGLN